MRTFSTIEGLPVIDLSSGNECGHVLDLLFSGQEVIGFVIDQKGWFNHHLFLPISAVSSFGNDGVMVEERKVLHPYKKEYKEEAFPLKLGKRKFQGKPLLTTEGEKIGLVEDVYFSEEVGTIIGYEVTDGLLADIVEGRKVVKSKGQLTIGEDRAILSI
ncbi:PRC-barrel domain-containing protein [Halalkalibacter urbisdiaboli]|uniref:PRC-barrel domain-containing protein n=1 Tax=Halalkalibacter urbisdiaboli TaxID=1960589 RepID=UPI000B42E873|nr:PRC-barrel domain-containing protein [Halalkalibacter urbisdiaboli]